MIRTIVVDDEADGREALKTALERYCPEVEILRICETPERGLEAIKALQPDLVLLDVQMPHLSGFDLLQRIEKINFAVIFVTAFDRYAIKAIKFSALDYLLKPVDV
ncbi:MAG: response regulator, partial [Ferruginibacter sp.]|nr:response regulator [Cytophagales bacterium]